MVTSKEKKLLLEKITGKIILMTIVLILYYFIELETELQEKKKELMTFSETLQVTTGTV